jgi:RNA polymerase-binding transcription factor DksA
MTNPQVLAIPTTINPEQLLELAAALAEQETFRVEQIRWLSRSANEATNDDEVFRTISRGAHIALAEVRAARQRMDEGSYGICTGCATPLSLELLEVMPSAAKCVPCREREAVSQSSSVVAAVG